MAGRPQNIYLQHSAVRADDELKVTVTMKMLRPGDHGNLRHYRIQDARVLMGGRSRSKKMRNREKHQNDTEYFSERGHVSDWVAANRHRWQA